MKTLTLKINEPRYEVMIDGKEVHLAPKEYDILLLLKKKNVTMSREDLMASLWKGPSATSPDTRTVDQHIARLRRKIGREFITTVPSRGYKFSA